MNEFICMWCRNSLRQKNPKMPDQACANGLQLHDIPQDLQNIFPLERRVMPSELQLHPVKLKCKLEYKSHYMYDMICRDHVISAITWLKEHNSHYADIKLNEHWYNNIASKEMSFQLDENDNPITVT